MSKKHLLKKVNVTKVYKYILYHATVQFPGCDVRRRLHSAIQYGNRQNKSDEEHKSPAGDIIQNPSYNMEEN